MEGLLHLSKANDAASVNLVWNILRERHNADLAAFSSGVFENTLSTEFLSLGISLRTSFLSNTFDASDILKHEFYKMLAASSELSIIKIGELFRIVSSSSYVKDHFWDAPEEVTAGAEGLGITLASPVNGKSSEDGGIIRAPFWLLVSFQKGRCDVLYFSKSAPSSEKAALLRIVKKFISDCSEKVNRLILLNRLNETHKASKYLIPLNASDKDSPLQDGSSEDEEVSCPSSYESTDSYIRPLTQGCFACPSVYKKMFPLHWRLRPLQVLNSIVMTINPLLITNRKNLFVFATRESIFYFHLIVKDVGEDAKADKDVEGKDGKAVNKESASIVAGVKESPKTPGSPSSRRPINVVTSGNTSVGAPRQIEHALIIDFFGVEPPGKEIIVDFMSHIELKLNTLTQVALSTYLSRSVAVKLTKADVDFILPIARAPQTPPTRRECLTIPEEVQNPYLLMLLLRQYMLTFLSPLGGNDVVTALRKYYAMHFGYSETPRDEIEGSGERKSFELSIGDFSFLYNGVSSRNQTGIASICVALLDPNGCVVTEAPKLAVFNFSDDVQKLAPVLDRLSQDWNHLRMPEDTQEPKDYNGYRILVEVWTVNPLDLDLIFEKITKGLNETLHDYLVETCVRRYASELTESLSDQINESVSSSAKTSDDNEGLASLGARQASRVGGSFSSFISNLNQILKRSSNLNHVSVQELSSPVKLPHWIIEEFAAEIQDILNDVSILPAPLMVKKDVNSQNVKSPESVFEVFRPSRTLSEGRAAYPHSLRSDDEFIVIVGFREFSYKYSNANAAGGVRDGIERKQSFDSDSSGFNTPPGISSSVFGQSRWPSVDDSPQEPQQGNTGGRRGSRRMAPYELGPTGWTRSAMEEVMFYSGFFHSTVLELGPRSCFLIMSIDNDNLSVYTYNWHRSHCDHVFGQVLRILSWNNIRMQFLDRQNPSSVNGTPNMDYKPSDYGSYNPASAFPPGIIYSSSYGGVQGVGFAALQQFSERPLSTFPGGDVKKGSSDQIKRTFSVDADILQRHAVEYLDQFVRHIRLPHRAWQSAHEIPVASKVQLKPKAAGRKWDDGTASITTSHEAFDKNEDKTSERLLTISELADILRSVRLHFARCLLLFSDLRSSFLPKGTQESDEFESPRRDTEFKPEKEVLQPEIINWHKQMIDTFMKEYVSYLVSLGMEVVSYFKPESLKDISGTDIAGLGILGGMNQSGINGFEGVAVQIGIGVSPSYSINHSTSVDVGIIYLRKTLPAGILIVQLSIDQVFVSLNLYTLKYPDMISLYDTEDDISRPHVEKTLRKSLKWTVITSRTRST
ncbi:hypothetical protein BC829DRAFT_55259 [Chytridium lagenaria]|nr:hypothetical protein BC829DRAFT_55259 [Chytridium lagenaria]